MLSARSATTRLGNEQILGKISDNLLVLETTIENQTKEGDLVVVVGHNVGGSGESPVLMLASGDNHPASVLGRRRSIDIIQRAPRRYKKHTF
jgi:hypothetical protein